MTATEIDDDVYSRIAETLCLEPEGDDGDGETDASPTPLETVVPWPREYDDDRRRFEGEELLFLTTSQWVFLDTLRQQVREMECRAVGDSCVWTNARITGGLGPDIVARPSLVLGGTFLLFDLAPSFPGA